MNNNNAKYVLRFFFDYGAGGCLWSGNEKTRIEFDVGCLDVNIFDFKGNIIRHGRIDLPDNLKNKVLELDKLYSESLNWNDPSSPSLWDKKQWEYFFLESRKLHKQISEMLGCEYEVLYEQEK